MIHVKDPKSKSALSTRWAQMSKQEQIIEKKKIEIQAKLEAQKQAAALAAQAKLQNPNTTDDNSVNIFSNDGSFMNQFKALLEKQKKQDKDLEKDKEKELQAQKSKESLNNLSAKSKKQDKGNFKEPKADLNDGRDERDKVYNREKPHYEYDNNRRGKEDKRSRDRNRRWGDKGRTHSHSPLTPALEERQKSNDNIPPLMSFHNMHPNDDSSETDENQWDRNPAFNRPPGFFGPGPNMGSNPNMSHGQNMGPGPNMGPGSNMGPGPNMGLGPNMGPMGPGPNSMMGPNMPPGLQMPPGGPMPPFMGPPFPPFMGPNGPGGPPNMCGPGGPGPMPPFFGPPFPNGPMMGPPGGPMMGPNGPPLPNMMPPNSINNGNIPSLMGPQPSFGANGPNGPPSFNNANGPPNIQFMPPSSMAVHTIPEPKPMDAVSIPPPEPMQLNNIPAPMLLPLNNIPKPKDVDNESPPTNSQVLSPDAIPPSVQHAAAEVAKNGDQWENALKAIHSQDQNLWFLHNVNSNEYKAFRVLVNNIRQGSWVPKTEIKPEDKYEPEFSLEDDDSEDGYNRSVVKEENTSRDSYGDSNSFGWYPSGVKREQASSQSDEEGDSRKERAKRKKKSRWGEDPPVDIKPPGLAMPPLPAPPIPGPYLTKVEDEGFKLTTVNRNNQALMQYAMTNYGTTNLSPEDWNKCEDNFKLNLLYQDMLKKRQEVERLAAAGKHKYEYDSDEDTSEGTWEHRLRSREMNATERWATELTKQAAGKHHIGDFLPPEELKKFMEKYSAVKCGKEPDFSDYKEFKLTEDNVGFKLLQKLGWSEGQGLGVEGTGIVDPINKSNQPVANLGLGAASSDMVSSQDDEFDAYRKRMMLAYRFRPNPLNNPRRPYY